MKTLRTNNVVFYNTSLPNKEECIDGDIWFEPDRGQYPGKVYRFARGLWFPVQFDSPPVRRIRVPRIELFTPILAHVRSASVLLFWVSAIVITICTARGIWALFNFYIRQIQ